MTNGRARPDHGAPDIPALIRTFMALTTPLGPILDLRRLAARRERAVRMPSQIESAACAALRRDGVFVTSLAAMGLQHADSNDPIAEAWGIACASSARAAASKGRRPPVLSSRPADLMRFPEIYRWGLNPVLLGIAESHFGLPVGYDGPLIFHTAMDPAETGTRRWHLDREDPEVLKVEIYLNDVDSSNGPFQILKRQEMAPPTFPGFLSLSTTQLQDKIGEAITPEMTRTCEGPAGTVIIAETGRRYHRGAPASRTERSVILYSYFPRPPRHPAFCGRPRLSRAQLAQLTEFMSPGQRASALWWDTV